MHDQLDGFEQAMQHAQQAAEDRAKDHARWVVSERLLQALDRYDNADLINGLAFAEQTGQCVIGMELSEGVRRCWTTGGAATWRTGATWRCAASATTRRTSGKSWRRCWLLPRPNRRQRHPSCCREALCPASPCR
jgi:predicted phage tail protein